LCTRHPRERDLQDNLITTMVLDKASLIEGLGRVQTGYIGNRIVRAHG